MIVLDTHAWIWWVSSDRHLSDDARQAIEKAMGTGSLYVSSISVWEVALLVAKRRLKLTLPVEDWIARAEALPFVTFVAVDNHLALRSVQLTGLQHDDPADRIILVTAISLGARLVTKDQRLHEYPDIETVW